MAHQSNPEQADIDTTHSVSRPQIIADGAENPNEWTDYTGTSSSTEHGIQVKSPSLSPPATNDTVTETPSASSSITEPRIYKRIHRFLSRNFGSTNKSPLRQSSFPSRDTCPTPQAAHNPQQLNSLLSAAQVSTTDLFATLRKSTEIPYIQASGGTSKYYSTLPLQHMRPGVSASNHRSGPSHIPDHISSQKPLVSWQAPISAGHYLNPNDVTSTYAPSTRSTVLSTRPKEDGYVATDPFRAHSRNNGLENQTATGRLTFDDIPTSATQPYSARISAISTCSSAFPSISSRSYLPERPYVGYPLPFPPNKQFAPSAQPGLGPEFDTKSSPATPPSFSRPRKSFEYPPASYAEEHRTEHKDGHLPDEKIPGMSPRVVEPSHPDEAAAVDQRGNDHSSDNTLPPQHSSPDAPDMPSVALPNLPIHHPLPLNSNTNANKSQGFWSHVSDRFGGFSSSRLEARQHLYEAASFVGETLPRQIYLHFLLRLPLLYFSRVARIFEEADLTLPEIKRMALETASQGSANLNNFYALTLEAGIAAVPPQYEKLKATWESFIDSVMREWKTFNIISVLLLSAIVTILQIPGASDDPVTRYSALLSLMCALLSLLFGCTYIIRFGTMRKTYKAAEWALEAKRTKTAIWWNVWVLLAMPIFWLTWSIILYIVCIMSFIWRTNARSTQPPPALSDTGLLIIRVIISSVLGLGLLYGALVLRTFSRYGATMDRAWKRRINGWIQEKILLRSPFSYHAQLYEPHPAPSGQYPHFPEPYTQSLPLSASSANDALSTFHTARSNTPNDQSSASILPERVAKVNRINPPMYVPGSGDRKLENEPLPSKRRQVAADNPIRKTGFHVPSESPREIPPLAESDIQSTDIRQNDTPSDDDSLENEFDFYASCPSSPVDGERDEVLENRVQSRSPLLSAITSNFRGGGSDRNVSRPVSPVISLSWVSTAQSQNSLYDAHDAVDLA